jgi:hypothetical protein
MMQKVIRFVAILLTLTTCFTLLLSSRANAATTLGTVTLWLQATDSCQEGLPGASFSLVSAGGQATVAPVTRGTERATIGSTSGGCPITRGNCAQSTTGCTIWHIVVPGTGSVTYTIAENITKATAHGITFTENPTGPGGGALLGFVACTGGSACHRESGTITVSSSGYMRAIVSNVSPDRSVQNYGPFAGTIKDPVLFHNYGVGSNTSDPCVASAGNVQMNYGTGTQSGHCRYVP